MSGTSPATQRSCPWLHPCLCPSEEIHSSDSRRAVTSSAQNLEDLEPGLRATAGGFGEESKS